MARRFRLNHLLFFGFTLISAVPVLFLAVWVQRSALEKEIAAVEEKHLLLARNLGGVLARYAFDVESGFRITAANLRNGQQITGLPELLRSLQFAHVCIADKGGKITQFTAVSPDLKMTSVPPKVFDQLSGLREKARREPGKVFFSGVMADGKGKPAIFLVQGLPRQQVAIGSLTTDFVVSVQKAISFGKKGHAAIVDREGRVLAHPNPEWRASMKDISAVKPVRQMMAGETGVTTFYSPALKADMVAGFTAVPGVGWGAMIPQPYAELEGRARDVRFFAAAIAAGGILVAAFISWWLARFLAGPIQEVVVSARGMAAGRPTGPLMPPRGLVPAELHELTDSFNRMVAELGFRAAKNAEISARSRDVVRQVAGGASLDTVLTLVVETAQDAHPGMLCSILVLDREKKRFRRGVAPALPDFYNEAIEKMEIGAEVGCCGAAVFTGERVVAPDVMVHPNWVQFRDLAAKAGLRACWSQPIKSTTGEILGAFAMYYRQPQHPTPFEIDQIESAAGLAGLAIARARTEEALRESEEQYRAVVEDQTELICRLRPDGTFTFVNDAFCRYFGQARENLIGGRATFFGSGGRSVEQLLRVLNAAHPVKTSEESVSTPDGRVLWQQWTDRAICDASGNVVEIQGVGRDITALKEAEEQLNQALRMESLGKLAGGVAHEFNNLLQIIGGHAHLIEAASRDNPEVGKLVPPIRKAVERGADLTQRFLAFGRRQRLQPQVVNLGRVLADTVAMMRRPLGEKIELGTTVAENLWEVLADKSYLENALLNLAINSRDAMPDGGNLTFEADNKTFVLASNRQGADGLAGDFVMVSVTDTGFGMTPEVRDRVFEPFFTTKGLANHSGLGLSMVYGFVKQSGGHVELESEPGRGMNIRLYLPRAPVS